MGKNNRVKRNPTMDLNIATYNFYYSWLKLIALNVVRWENAPTTIDVRFLELTLFERGMAVWFKDSILGELALPVNLSGSFSVYGVPINYYAYSQTAYTNRKLNASNSVLIWNNYLRESNETIVQLYARKLANIDRAMDVNIESQKTPVIVECSEQQRLTMQVIQTGFMTNESYIWIDSQQGRNGINVMKCDSPYVADKFEILKHDLFNDFLAKIGVENSNADKKERMVADEVGSNYGLVEVDRNIILTPRQEACDKINAMFPHDIPLTVCFNSDVKTLVNQGAKEMGIDIDMEEGVE